MTRCQRCQEPGSFALPVPGDRGASRCWQPFLSSHKVRAGTELLCLWPERRCFHRVWHGSTGFAEEEVCGVCKRTPLMLLSSNTCLLQAKICLATIIVQPPGYEENAFQLKRLISSAYRSDLWDKGITTGLWCCAAAKSFGNTFRECWKEEGPHETPVKHQHGTGRVQIFSCCAGINPGRPDVWDGGTAFRWCLKHTYISDLESSTEAADQKSDLLNIFKLTTALWDGSSMNLPPANHH